MVAAFERRQRAAAGVDHRRLQRQVDRFESTGRAEAGRQGTGGQRVNVRSRWPLVVANMLAAALIEMAPALVRRRGRDGRLVLSGIPCAAEADVDRAYTRLGVRRLDAMSRAGWTALVLQASW